MRQKKNGFTLVELAIVIIIIGLLVAGILQGQALIEAAKINRAISDFKKFNTSILTFKAKYNAMPGDMRNAYTMFDGSGGSDICGPNNATDTGCNGNGDTLIGSHTNVAEGAKLWVHLVLAKLSSDVVYRPGASYRNLESDSNISNAPASTFGDGIVFDFQSPRFDIGRYSTGVFYGRSGLWISLTKVALSPANYNIYRLGNVMTPAQSMQFDVKIDDGLPTTGALIAARAAYGPYGGNCASTDIHVANMGTTAPSDTIVYQISNSQVACGLMLKTAFE